MGAYYDLDRSAPKLAQRRHETPEGHLIDDETRLSVRWPKQEQDLRFHISSLLSPSPKANTFVLHADCVATVPRLVQNPGERSREGGGGVDRGGGGGPEAPGAGTGSGSYCPALGRTQQAVEAAQERSGIEALGLQAWVLLEVSKLFGMRLRWTSTLVLP